MTYVQNVNNKYAKKLRCLVKKKAPDLGPKLGRLLSWSGLSDVARSTRPREGRVH